MRKKHRQEFEQDFELNIASIIDCFTVLITYLLLATSFISLGILDVTVATKSPEAKVDTPPPLTVTIGVMKNNEIKINTEGNESNTYKLKEKNGTMDFEGLTAHLQKFKEQYPALDSAMITAEDTLEYKALVKTVEVTRNTLPKVALSADLESPGIQ